MWAKVKWAKVVNMGKSGKCGQVVKSGKCGQKVVKIVNVGKKW